MSKNRQIFVIGLPRAGGSAVAAILLQIGVDMGRQFHAVEDNVAGEFEELACFNYNRSKSHDLQFPARYVAERNALAPLWGVKDPALVDTVGALWRHCSDPRIIVATRHPAAVTASNEVAYNRDRAEANKRLHVIVASRQNERLDVV